MASSGSPNSSSPDGTMECSTGQTAFKPAIQCKQAHGGPTGLVSEFSNRSELYQKIADCFGFPVGDVGNSQ